MGEAAPHNRFKVPFHLLVIGVGVFCAIVGAVTGTPALLTYSLLLVAVSVAMLWVVRRQIRAGRNPWWMRSPLDGRGRTAQLFGGVAFAVAVGYVLFRMTVITVRLIER